MVKVRQDSLGGERSHMKERASMPVFANTPEPPYYAAIFSALRTEAREGYEAVTQRMLDLARQQPGFLGIEAVEDDLFSIGVSYWQSPEAIIAWRQQMEHLEVQRAGQAHWYRQYRVRICKVERDYAFDLEA